MEQFIGMMFCKNEADIIEQTVRDAASKVDQLFISDDGSSDNSWKIIQSLKNEIDNITWIQREPNSKDAGQRQSLLNKIKLQFRPEDVFVQIIEADVFLLNEPRNFTQCAIEDIAITWKSLNAVRKSWKGIDTYPNWNTPIKEIMNLAHEMPPMLYTFRPLPKINYSDQWRPWPSGFSYYIKGEVKQKRNELENHPILLHCGYRGPTHFYQKYKEMGRIHKRRLNWDISSIEAIERTVGHFTTYPDKAKPWKEFLNGPI